MMMEECVPDLTRFAPPEGGRRILRATPTAAGPYADRQSEIWKNCKTSRKADQYTSRPALLCLFCLVCLVCLLSLWSVFFVCVVCLLSGKSRKTHAGTQ